MDSNLRQIKGCDTCKWQTAEMLYLPLNSVLSIIIILGPNFLEELWNLSQYRIP